MNFTEKKDCRVCGTKLPEENILTLGSQAIVDFLAADETGRGEAPLDLVKCSSCSLIQLRHTVNPDTLFRKFYYRSGINEQMKEALKDIVDAIRSRVTLKPRDYVLDIGSNDGTLLSNYPIGLHKVGFEPALELAQESQSPAVTIVPNYFNAEEALKVSNHAQYKAITAIAMFYDLDDPNKFLEHVYASLHPNGIFVVQMNYLPLMLRNVAFDNIGHEHLCYYSLTSLKNLFDRNGLQITEVEINSVNGGSFRVYARKLGTNNGIPSSVNLQWKTHESVDDTLLNEELVLSEEVINNFSQKVIEIVNALDNFLLKANNLGKKVYAYGASTRGLTLLQTLGQTSKFVKGAAERDPRKFGKKMAGVNTPIVSEAEARADADYFLLLPYSFWESISQREREWLEKGGKFIIPVPFPKVVSWEQTGLNAKALEEEL